MTAVPHITEGSAASPRRLKCLLVTALQTELEYRRQQVTTCSVLHTASHSHLGALNIYLHPGALLKLIASRRWPDNGEVVEKVKHSWALLRHLLWAHMACTEALRAWHTHTACVLTKHYTARDVSKKTLQY